MDSNDLERERGITILAKAPRWSGKDTRINIVDTPGHADFGGEVERILNMVDGVSCWSTPPKARCRRPSSCSARRCKLGLKPIVVHQQDRPARRAPDRSAQRGVRPVRRARRQRRAARFPDPLRLRPSRAGCRLSPTGRARTMAPLFDLIVDHVPRRRRSIADGPSACWRRRSRPTRSRPRADRPHRAPARSRPTRPSRRSPATARSSSSGRVSKVLAFRGLERAAGRGSRGRRHHRHRRPARRRPSPTRSATPPSPSRSRPSRSTRRRSPMTFRINDGPLAGREGDKVQSRVIRDRLLREAEGNVALKVDDGADEATPSKSPAAANCSSAS